jgi:hypothetical protein
MAKYNNHVPTQQELRDGRRIFGKVSKQIYDDYIYSELPSDDGDSEQILKFFKEMLYYKISEIFFVDGYLCIKLGRPGVFIGVKGENFDKYNAIAKDFCKKTGEKYKSIQLIEDRDPLQDALFQGFYDSMNRIERI